MSEVKITFYKCIRDRSDYTNDDDDEHMLSRIYMVIDVDGRISGTTTAASSTRWTTKTMPTAPSRSARL